VSWSALRDWARRRTEAEWVALAAGAAVFGYVGWDGALWDARFQLLLHLFAAGAIAGVSLIGLRGGALPRTRVDVPLLGLVAAFALATVSAVNVGMSLRAMAVIVATAAMLPVALIAIRLRPSWVGALTSVPVLLLSIPALAVLVARRIEWIVAGAPGLPPLRLAGEGTPYGSVAVPPFVIWPAWALAGLIEHDGWRRTIRTGLVAVGIPFTILSGSRSAWLAIGATVLVAGVPWAWERRHRLRIGRRPTLRELAPWAIGAVAMVGVALLAIPRLTAVTSLLYRVSLWRDTLNAWATDPLLGIGPGIMPYARQAAAPDFSFPVRQPHSHNLPLGILGDAGIVGLAAAIIVVAAMAWVANPWRMRTPVGRTASFVLLGLAIGGLFEDLTFLPNFNLLAIGLLAVALTDAGAVEWVRLPSRSPRGLAAIGGSAAAAAVLLAAMVTADAGAIAFRGGVDAAGDDRMDVAAERFARSVEIDPWHPGGPKALAVAADAAGDAAAALEAAEIATQLNPGDGPSWVNLALLCAAAGDRECQAMATERAVATASFLRAELVNAALSYEALGRAEAADDAYRRSLLSQRLTALASDWPRPVRIGEGGVEDQTGGQVDLNLLLAWWHAGERVDPTRIADPATRALAHAMLGERTDAETWLARAIDERPDEIPTWETAIVLRDHWGLPVDRELRIDAVVRGNPFPPRDPSHELPRLTFDIASFRAYPRDQLVRTAFRFRPDPGYPWALQETLP
jgi:tetratricopeptide (TPR) repeat protein